MLNSFDAKKELQLLTPRESRSCIIRKVALGLLPEGKLVPRLKCASKFREED